MFVMQGSLLLDGQPAAFAKSLTFHFQELTFWGDAECSKHNYARLHKKKLHACGLMKCTPFDTCNNYYIRRFYTSTAGFYRSMHRHARCATIEMSMFDIDGTFAYVISTTPGKKSRFVVRKLSCNCVGIKGL
jgi:hypothetical protein